MCTYLELILADKCGEVKGGHVHSASFDRTEGFSKKAVLGTVLSEGWWAQAWSGCLPGRGAAVQAASWGEERTQEAVWWELKVHRPEDGVRPHSCFCPWLLCGLASWHLV